MRNYINAENDFHDQAVSNDSIVTANSSGILEFTNRLLLVFLLFLLAFLLVVLF